MFAALKLLLPKILPWLKNNWKLVGTIIALVGLFLFLLHIYKMGETACENATLVRTVTKTITIQEKKNEIRDNRPDTKRVVKRLLANTF